MKKTILNLGKALNKAEQKEIHGGRKLTFGPVVCFNPYFNDRETCMIGYHPHPTHGVCICCRD